MSTQPRNEHTRADAHPVGSSDLVGSSGDHYEKLTPKDRTEYHKRNRTNKTGYVGVKRTRNGYAAYIRVHGRKEKLYCGSSKTAEEAAKIYDAKARELYGTEAVTNFEPTDQDHPQHP